MNEEDSKHSQISSALEMTFKLKYFLRNYASSYTTTLSSGNGCENHSILELMLDVTTKCWKTLTSTYSI